MTTALVPYSDIERMGIAIAKSGLFGMKTPEQAIALMLIAQAEGLHPAIAARDYHVIQGRPALKSDAMLARFQAAGGAVKWLSYDDKKVSAVFTHPQGGSVEITWTIEQATAAKLTGKDTWKQYPRQMLRARVISEGIRTVFPGCVVDQYTPEEVQDFESAKLAPRDVTPEQVPPTAPCQSDEEKVQSVFPDAAPVPQEKSGRTISEKQRKRLFAIAHGSGWGNEDLKQFLKDSFGIEHSDQVDVADYEKICSMVAAGPPVPEEMQYTGELG